MSHAWTLLIWTFQCVFNVCAFVLLVHLKLTKADKR